MTTQRMWHRAALRRDEELARERSVGWLELFFDLVFVVILAEVAHGLAHHVDLSHLVAFSLQFMAIFWVWNSFTYYTERFETDGLENRLFVFLAILTVAGLAIWGEDGLDGAYVGFAGSYLAARGLNIALWLRAGLHERTFLPIAARFATGFVIAAILLGISFTVEGPPRLALWTAAVLIEIAAPAFTTRQQGALPPLSRSKWPERFGLFTMIVLGEAVALVIRGLSTVDDEHHLGVAAMVQGAAGLSVGFALWWLYFDFIARRPSRPQIPTALGWVYLHLITLTTATIVGVAIAEVLVEASHGELPDQLRLLLLGGVGAAAVAIGVLETTLDRDDDEPTGRRLSPLLKIMPGAALIVLGLLDLPWAALPALLVCLLTLAIPAVYGSIVWFRRG